MGPRDLPDGSFVRVEVALNFLIAICAYTTNLHETLAVTAGDLGSVVIELAVIDVVLVVGVQGECIRSGLLCTLSSRVLTMRSLSLTSLRGNHF